MYDKSEPQYIKNLGNLMCSDFYFNSISLKEGTKPKEPINGGETVSGKERHGAGMQEAILYRRLRGLWARKPLCYHVLLLDLLRVSPG